jgi:hypothetical protein
LSNLPQAANVFITKREKENEARLAKERELQKVQVKKEDIELIVSPFFLMSNQLLSNTLIFVHLVDPGNGNHPQCSGENAERTRWRFGVSFRSVSQ